MEEINANVNNSNALATAEADAETLGTPPRKGSLGEEFSLDSWLVVVRVRFVSSLTGGSCAKNVKQCY